MAEVRDLVEISVGADVSLGKVVLKIEGVEAQALLKARLDNVSLILERVLMSLDRNPELLEGIGHAAEEVGEGAGHLVGQTGEAVEDIGEGAGGAVQDVGSGAGQAVGEIGEGANQAVGQIGEGAGQAVGDVGEGAGQAVGNVGQTVEGVGQVAGQAGQAVGQAGQGVGEAVGGAAEGAGGALGEVDQAAAALIGGNGGGVDTSATGIAKLAAKMVVHELKSAATEEAKGLGLAAARKAKEVGERRNERKAEEVHATEAAMRAAEELDVDLDDVDGTGPEGRITIRDVRQAQEA